MSKILRYKVGPILLVRIKGYSYDPGWGIGIGSRLYFPGIPAPILRAARFIRGLFPSFYVIGLHDCDTGGRICYRFRAMAWNARHLKRIEREWDLASDGPATVWPVSPWVFFRYKGGRA